MSLLVGDRQIEQLRAILAQQDELCFFRVAHREINQYPNGFQLQEVELFFVRVEVENTANNVHYLCF